MDFAEKQLTKHGWQTGSGLGKDETGITEPIKAKIKHDTRGVGHDAGKEFTFHWWDHMFNKAASSIEVEHTQDGVQVKKSSSSKSSKKSKTYENKAMLYDQFVKGATLSGGKYEAEEKVVEEEESDHETPSKSSIIPANEEEVFKQCGGRTAHKGARHGLKMNAKLARIEQQEQELLDKLTKTSQGLKTDTSTPDHSVQTGVDTAINGVSDIVEGHHKSKKRKRKETAEIASWNKESAKLNNGLTHETDTLVNGETKSVEGHRKSKKGKRKERAEILSRNTDSPVLNNGLEHDTDTLVNGATESIEGHSKRKKGKNKEINGIDEYEDTLEDQDKLSKKKKKRKKDRKRKNSELDENEKQDHTTVDSSNCDTVHVDETSDSTVKNRFVTNERCEFSSTEIEITPKKSKKKKKKKDKYTE